MQKSNRRELNAGGKRAKTVYVLSKDSESAPNPKHKKCLVCGHSS